MNSEAKKLLCVDYGRCIFGDYPSLQILSVCYGIDKLYSFGSVKQRVFGNTCDIAMSPRG